MEKIKQIMEYIVAIVLTVLCVVLPLYAKDGYHKIDSAKFSAYKAIMIPGLAILLVMAALYFIFREDRKGKGNISITDYFVFAYLLLTNISVACGGFYKDALWGSAGWYMGFMSQLSFVLLYFFLSRFGRYHRCILAALCGAAVIVFLLGILNRLQIDPLGYYDGLTPSQKARFLSTMGQATWYASFLVVVLPIGLAGFLYSEDKRIRAAGGVFSFIGFCSLVTQNSDSAYFAVGGFLLVFLWGAVKKQDRLLRFILAGVMFLAAGKVMHFLFLVHPNPELKFDLITNFILSSGAVWGILALCIIGYGALYFYGKRKGYPLKQMEWLCKGVYLLAAIGAMVVIALIILNARGILPEGLANRVSDLPYMNWEKEWGNGRGRIWAFAAKVFMEESPINKLFGIGPDCFYSYITANYGEDVALYWGDLMLTNAHNEWMTAFINGGIFGGLAYLGIYATAFWRFIKSAEYDFLLAGVAAAIASYVAYNFFCYQQILCTPFIFILMGIGEYLVREGNALDIA